MVRGPGVPEVREVTVPRPDRQPHRAKDLQLYKMLTRKTPPGVRGPLRGFFTVLSTALQPFQHLDLSGMIHIMMGDPVQEC
jgi:hypothetical protein